MRKLDFSINSKKVSVDVPEHWHEMSEKQFKAVCRISNKEIDDATFYSEFFSIPVEWVNSIDLYYFYVLNSLLGFTRDVEAFSGFLVAKVGDFVSPQPNLSGMSFHQFMTIDTFFTWYLQTNKDAFLDKMCATMYLLTCDDFSKLDLDARAEVWAKVDKSDKYALLISWTIIKKWLSKGYTYLFPKGDDDAHQHGSKKISNTWLEIFDTLVQEDLSKIEAYKKVEAMDVIRIVNRRIKEQKHKK